MVFLFLYLLKIYLQDCKMLIIFALWELEFKI
nr:MAG TPA: hypothetical protein [Caudoviricetes sp.]